MKRKQVAGASCTLVVGRAAMLVFPLPEHEDNLRMAQEGPAARLVLHDVANGLRRRLKYEEHPEPVRIVLEQVREEFIEALRDHGIDLEW